VASILPNEGFSEVLLLRGINKYFPIFDILAKRDGQDHGIQVTSDLRRRVPMEHLALCERLGLKYLLCFVKPGFSLYYFREVKYDPQRKAINVMVPMRIIRNREPQIRNAPTTDPLGVPRKASD